MTEFTVHLANRPGQLAALARRLGDAGVNIDALAAFAAGDAGVVRIVAEEADTARRVLEDACVPFEEHRIVATVVRNQPGALAHLTESLAETGVNIDAMYLLHADGEHLQFALAVNDPESVAEHLSI